MFNKKIISIILILVMILNPIISTSALSETTVSKQSSYTEWSMLGGIYSDKDDMTGNISKSFNRSFEMPFITYTTTLIASSWYKYSALSNKEIGIFSKSKFSTANLKDWASNSNGEIQFWVKSEKNSSFQLVIQIDTVKAYANVNLNGLDEWQEIRIKSSQFTDIQKIYNQLSTTSTNNVYISVVINESSFVAGQRLVFGNLFEAYSGKAFHKGDANCDGEVDIRDFVKVKKLLADDEKSFDNCDIDLDGKLSSTDTVCYRRWLLFNKWDKEDANKTYKVLFIGNSFTYYGRAVEESYREELKISYRQNDQGMFAQLCKENGMSVEVTNWTWPTHTLEYTFSGYCEDSKCQLGVDHLSYLTDRNYDYVVIQEGSAITDTLDYVYNVMEIFKAYNPDVEFVLIEQSRAHFNNFPRLRQLKEFAQKGVMIADWGDLVVDVINGKVSVPNAKLKYNQNSFIVSKSATDGYHPNMLSGYITALMTYCLITGEKAVGQSYAFCGDTTISSVFDFTAYNKKFYKYSPSNFIDIFNSASDMKGIQQLVDKYIAEKPYMNF